MQCRDIDAIENVLSSYTRRIFKKFGLPRMSYSERLAFLGMSSLEFSRFVSCLTMFFTIYHHFVCCNVLKENSSKNVCMHIIVWKCIKVNILIIIFAHIIIHKQKSDSFCLCEKPK